MCIPIADQTGMMLEIAPENSDRKELTNRLHKTRRNAIFAALRTKLAGEISNEELDIHFTHMPDRYWPRATEDSVGRHLRLFRQFFTRLATAPTDSTAPVVTWRQIPERHVTEVTICTWDRLGLLSRVAGAFAAVEINILRADIYTRIDHVALDVFEVCDDKGDCLWDEARLHLMAAFLNAALLPEARPAPVMPPRRTTSRKPRPAPQVDFDHDPDNAQTVIVVEANDQIGLLHRLFTALAECGVNVAQAIITTEGGRAGDVLYVTDTAGHPITNPLDLDNIRSRLLAVL